MRFFCRLLCCLIATFLSNCVYSNYDADVDHYIHAAKECFRVNSSPRSKPRLAAAVIKYTNGEPLVHLESLIDDVDIHHINVLCACVRHFNSNHFQSRPFDSQGGNNVTYLNGFAQLILPDLVEHVRSVVSLAADKVGWRPHPLHLGIRCVEALSYSSGGELSLHQDVDSVYTIAIMLSDVDTFEGGSFVIKSDRSLALRNVDNNIRSSPVKGTGILFDSNAEHGIEPTLSGTRLVLSIELWVYAEAAVNEGRPPPDNFQDRVVYPALLMTTPPFVLEQGNAIFRVLFSSDTDGSNSALIVGFSAGSAISVAIAIVCYLSTKIMRLGPFKKEN